MNDLEHEIDAHQHTEALYVAEVEKCKRLSCEGREKDELITALREVLRENGIPVSEEQTCKSHHEKWQETYAGANCPDCGKEF